ncbi:MAG: acyltransferase [Anaerolineae bacterium]|nr:acyltransferase [Anaerolineae bacterium]
MNRQFSALQGFAILLVVLHHSIELGLDTPRLGEPRVAYGWTTYTLLTLWQLGILAVPTFLFISGSFFSYAAQGKNPPQLSWKVVRTGLKHLLWPYLFWSIAFYIWIYFRWNEAYTPLGYLKNLIVGFPFNFIPLVAFYYVLSPFLVRIAKRFGYLLILIIILYQLALLNIKDPNNLGFAFPGWMGFLAPPVLRETMAIWGVYFPLGLVYSINIKTILPWLQRLRWLLLTMTVVFFVISVLNRFSIWSFPLADFICPLMFVLFIPTLKRDAIPFVRELEKAGKKSYGIYLSHLIALDFLLLCIQILLPWMFNYQLLLQPILFVFTWSIPLLVMNGVMRLPTRPIYRYVFG